jgi:hypothetical protein
VFSFEDHTNVILIPYTLELLNCIRLSIFRTCTIILQNYAGNKQKLYKIMKMQMSVILAKAKLDTENIICLNLAAAKRTTVQASRLLL